MRIQLTWPWTAADGTKHPAGAPISVDERTGARLIYLGRARALAPTEDGAPAPDEDAASVSAVDLIKDSAPAPARPATGKGK